MPRFVKARDTLHPPLFPQSDNPPPPVSPALKELSTASAGFGPGWIRLPRGAVHRSDLAPCADCGGVQFGIYRLAVLTGYGVRVACPDCARMRDVRDDAGNHHPWVRIGTLHQRTGEVRIGGAR